MANNRVGRFSAPPSDIPIGINPPTPISGRKRLRKRPTGARRALSVGKGKKVGLRRRYRKRPTYRALPTGTRQRI